MPRRPMRALLVTLATWAMAAGAGAASPERAEQPFASLYAGLELGNTDSRRFEAGATMNPSSSWSASLALARGDFDFPGADASSSVGSLKALYHAGDFGVGAGVRRAEIDDVSATRGWLVTGYYEFADWRISADVETRDTSLEAAPFDDEEIPGIGRVSGVARCDVASVGYGTVATFTQRRWSTFAGLRLFDYDDFDCTLTLSGQGGPRPPRARGRGLGNRLASSTLALVTGFSPRLLPREATLLESSLSLGTTYSIDDRWLGGAEIYRDVERVTGDDFLTMLAFADRRMTDTLSVEVWVGFASGTFEDAAFAGVRVLTDL